MNQAELREWLGLTWADALLYVSAASVAGMYFVRVPTWDWVLALTAVVSAVVACPLGVRSKPGLSSFMNTFKLYSYPLFVLVAFAFVWLNFTRWG